MQTVFVVTLLVLLTGVQSRFTDSLLNFVEETNAPECGVIYKGTTWDGNDIEEIKEVKNAEECCLKCKEYGYMCRAYVYNSKSKKCYPKYAASAPRTCTECYGRNEFELTPKASCEPVYDKTRWGNDFVFIDEITQPNVCCEICYSHPDCVAWTWHRNENRCYLKDKQGEYKQCNACISGDKTVGPLPSISKSPSFAQ